MPTAVEYGIIEVCIRRRRRSPATTETTGEGHAMNPHESALYRAAGHCCQAAAELSEQDAGTTADNTADMCTQLRDLAQQLLDLAGPDVQVAPHHEPPPPPPPPPQPQRPPTRQPRR